MKVLDTSVLIDIDQNAYPSSIDTLNQEEKLFVSSISVFEFWWGISNHYKGDLLVPEEKELGFYEFFSAYEVIPVTLEISKIAANFSVQLKLEGNQIDLHDYYIAATAKIFNTPIVTKNIKHFSRINQITTIEWPFKKLP
jgi:predicted nucleic acid-binding protein